MSQRTHKMRFDVTGNAKKRLEETAEAADKMAAGFGRMEKIAGKFAISSAVATQALSVLVEFVGKGVEEFNAASKTSRQLSASLKATGASARQQTAAFRAAEQASNDYNFALSESLDYMRRLNDASGDATKAQRDLATAIKISRDQNIEMAEAVQILSEARKGEVEGLKKLRGFNKELVDKLAAIEDGAARTATAFDYVTAAVGDLNDVSKDSSDNLARMRANMDKISAASAGIANGMGKIINVLIPDALGGGGGEESYFDKFANAMGNWSDEIQNSAKEIENLYQAFKTLEDLEFVEAILSGDPIGYAEAAYATSFKKKNEAALRSTGYKGGVQTAPDVLVDPNLVKRGGGKDKPKAKTRGARKAAKEETPYGASVTLDELDDIESDVEVRQNRMRKIVADGKKAEKDAVFDRYQYERDQAEETAEHVKKFEELKGEAKWISARAAVDVADQLGANESVVAGIRAAMEVAEGLASLAPTPAFPLGNPAGAAAHFAAAAQFGVAAAMAGGGGGGASSKKGTPSTSAGVASANRERLNRQERQPMETNITLDFSRSVGVGPQAGRELAYEVRRGLDMTSGNGRIF